MSNPIYKNGCFFWSAKRKHVFSPILSSDSSSKRLRSVFPKVKLSSELFLTFNSAISSMKKPKFGMGKSLSPNR